MAVMVWCQSCKTVVWAYDHQPNVDLRGICNTLKLPCPKCGHIGNFDGWGSKSPCEALKDRDTQEQPIYDDWSAMKFIARQYGIAWEPSPDNTWFRRPNSTKESCAKLMKDISYLAQWEGSGYPELETGKKNEINCKHSRYNQTCPSPGYCVPAPKECEECTKLG